MSSPSDEAANTLRESLTELALCETLRVDREDSSAFPSELGRYQELTEIACGGMGRVLRGFDPEARREVAIKILKAGNDVSQQMLERFLIEGQLTARLEHPNIVPVHEVGLRGGTLYFTMKLVRGRRLGQAIASYHNSSGRDSLESLLGAYQKVCDAVAFSHSRNVIHRDLKPDNIMIGEFGEVLVMDWGVAKRLGEPAESLTTPAQGSSEPSLTALGTVVGTPQYMSPEQARGEIDLTGPASDIYSLGAILFHIVTGGQPFDGPTTANVIKAVQQGERLPVSRTQEGVKVCSELQAIVNKAMDPDPAQRYTDVTALQADIDAHLGGRMISAKRYRMIQRMAKQLSQRQGLSWSAVAILMITVLGMNLLSLWRGHELAEAGKPMQEGHLGVELSRKVTMGGIPVIRVLPGLEAERAGLQPGDIVVAIGRVKTPTFQRLGEALSILKPGTKTTLSVLRPGPDGLYSRLSLEVTLGRFW